jgi:hypothetical protein
MTLRYETQHDSLKRISVNITQEAKEFLDLIAHQDAANNLSEAVMWCIDCCMRIENLYGIDACYIAFNDIRKEENKP